MRGDGKTGVSVLEMLLENGPLGRPLTKEREIKTFLRARPLRTAQHALWAIQSMDLEHLVPDLALACRGPFLVEEAYRPGLDLIPFPWREEVEARTREHVADSR